MIKESTALIFFGGAGGERKQYIYFFININAVCWKILQNDSKLLISLVSFS